MSEEDDHDDFWGDDGGRRSSPRRQASAGPKGEGTGGGRGGLSDSQRKALPIVAAAAALLLIVVIFVVSRSSSSTSNNSTGTTAAAATDSAASAGSGGTTASTTAGKGTPAKKPQAKWSNGLVGSPLVFRDAQGNPSAEPPPGKTAKAGVYFWAAYDGWHVRVVKGDGVDKVDGTVTGVLNKQGAKVVKVTGADPSIATAQGGNLSFQVPAGGSGVVAIDFSLDANTTQAGLTLNDGSGSLDVKKIYVGTSASSPPSNPITFVKKSGS